MAKLSPAEVIELSFLSTLLERQCQDSQPLSNRFQKIKRIFEAIQDVVPLESVLSCIAKTESDQIVHQLSLSLKNANLKPQFSIELLINTALAITRLRGESLSPSKNNETLNLEALFYIFVQTAKRCAATSYQFSSLGRQLDPFSEVEGEYARKFFKWFPKPDGTSSKSLEAELINYFVEMVRNAIKSCSGRITAISGVTVKQIFKTTEGSIIKSPITLLKEGREKLKLLQDEMGNELRRQSSGTHEGTQPEVSCTQAYNARLLDYVNKLRGNDLHICIQILLSFMEERVHIPISEAKPVSYWKLMKLGLGIFRTKIPNKGITRYVSVSKHVNSIANEVRMKGEGMDTTLGDGPEQLYAGKLQFLFSAGQHSQESSLIDPEYPHFSLESHVFEQCEDRKITDLSLQNILTNWDEHFQGVSMSSVAQSHRSLIAAWLKFSLMIHKLRNELSCHTSMGVVGLVNSGKSTLVKQLFKIKVL